MKQTENLKNLKGGVEFSIALLKQLEYVLATDPSIGNGDKKYYLNTLTTAISSLHLVDMEDK